MRKNKLGFNELLQCKDLVSLNAKCAMMIFLKPPRLFKKPSFTRGFNGFLNSVNGRQSSIKQIKVCNNTTIL